MKDGEGVTNGRVGGGKGGRNLFGSVGVFGSETLPRKSEFEEGQVLPLFVVEDCEFIGLARRDVSEDGARNLVPRWLKGVFAGYDKKGLM